MLRINLFANNVIQKCGGKIESSQQHWLTCMCIWINRKTC